ncbi:MAG: hypothetical protein Ct9H90mP7_4790 [Candidatus Neomarinimicrobiota bacterium]|nr:MAG: hypothetical protein Ct9H90mP7_4790 [Candidatus Neomarinimicrobiota bacterium]
MSVVYAVDVQQEMLEINASQMRKKNITNLNLFLAKLNLPIFQKAPLISFCWWTFIRA